MELSVLKGCSFKNCTFGQLRVYESTAFNGVTFDGCTVDSVKIVGGDVEVWEPSAIRVQLEGRGVSFPQAQAPEASVNVVAGKIDPELRDVEKLIRNFMRSTHISESVILMKLGNRARCFLDDELPNLLKHRIMVEIVNRGGGLQRRFKFGKTLEVINAAINAAQGSYQRFIEECDRNE
jgi:hypothetical protein